MAAQVLVLNAGSSSLKYQLVDPVAGEVSLVGLLERIGEPGGHLTDHRAAFAAMQADLAARGADLRTRPPRAVGHRVVHGGVRFAGPTLVDDAVAAAIGDLAPLAPLHNPANLAGIVAARALMPEVPQIAVFDTAFHQTMPPRATCMRCRCEVAAAAPDPSLRLPRHLARARVATGTAAARFACALLDRGAPPGQRRQRLRRAGRAERRDLDGNDPDGGPGDGHPLRRPRPPR